MRMIRRPRRSPGPPCVKEAEEGGALDLRKTKRPRPKTEPFSRVEAVVRNAYTMPWDIMASASFLKPAMFAPMT